MAQPSNSQNFSDRDGLPVDRVQPQQYADSQDQAPQFQQPQESATMHFVLGGMLELLNRIETPALPDTVSAMRRLPISGPFRD